MKEFTAETRRSAEFAEKNKRTEEKNINPPDFKIRVDS
jgi:hypothetical protein